MKLKPPTKLSKERGNIVMHAVSCAHSRLLAERPSYLPFRDSVTGAVEIKANILHFADRQIDAILSEEKIQELSLASEEELTQSFVRLFSAFLKGEDSPPTDMLVELPESLVDVLIDILIMVSAVYQSFFNGMQEGLRTQTWPGDKESIEKSKKAHLN